MDIIKIVIKKIITNVKYVLEKHMVINQKIKIVKINQQKY